MTMVLIRMKAVMSMTDKGYYYNFYSELISDAVGLVQEILID